MGNPASPIIANIVMNHVISSVVTKLPFKLAFIKVYVDDTIIAVPKNKSQELLNIFNSFNNKIQFTMEVEENLSIPFLDLLLIRDEHGKIKTNWYVKPTNTGRLLNYNSNHPTVQKIGMIKGLLKRVLTLSHSDFHNDNLKRIELLLKNNNYPTVLIHNLINNFNLNRTTDITIINQ